MKNMTVERFAKFVKIGTGTVIGAAAIVFFCRSCVPLKDSAELNSVSGTLTASTISVASAVSEITQGSLPNSTQSDPNSVSESPKAALININTATSEELQALSGIGEAKAAAIIAYREEHGAFSDISEIMNVSGIGEKIFGNIRDSITTGGNSSTNTETSQVPASGPSVPSEEVLININTATSEELQALSGIGEAKAAAIIAYREEHGAFNDISGIMDVSGIGEKIFEKIRGQITV